MKGRSRQCRIRALLDQQGGRCFYCRQELGEEDASLDHLVPLSAGGRSDPENLVVCCRPVNYFLGNVSLSVKMRILADSGFLQTISRWCLVVDRNRS